MGQLLRWRNRIRIAIGCDHDRAMFVSSVDCGSYFLKATKGLFCGMTVWIRSYGDNGNLWANNTEKGRRRR